MNPDQSWMWGMGGMWMFPMIMFVILIIFLFVLIGRWSDKPPRWGSGRHHREGGESETALEILKKRYTKEEITKEEFEQMNKDILS